MSGGEHESRGEDVAAYLLGALEPEEAVALERHLEGCPECRAELRRLGPAVQRLAESVPRVEPPHELRARVLAEAGDDSARATARRPPHRRRLLFSGRRPLVGLATVAVLATVAGYLVGNSSSGGSGTTMVAMGKPPGMTARIVSEGDAGTLHLAHLGQLPRDEVLEAWVRRGGRVRPLRGLFVPDREGHATATIDDMSGVEAVMVTAEPRGGSQLPTSPPMVTLELG